MRFSRLTLLSVGLLAAVPGWADMQTYYVGFEDTNGGDYDYNDLIFSITGNNLMLHIGQNTPATWQSSPVVDNNQSPFWDRTSGDGGNQNVGWCIYGGGTGNCANGGVVPMLANAEYLATVSGGAVNNVSFTVSPSKGASNDVNSRVYARIGVASTRLGWYQDNSSILNNGLNTIVSELGGVYSFDPAANTPFGLWACVNDRSGLCTGNIFATRVDANIFESTVGDSHFAFFREGQRISMPESGSIILLGTAGLLAMAGIRRRLGKS